MELKAKFKKQLEIVERSNFKSRKVWIVTEDNPQYPQTIEIEVSGDKCGMFDNVAEGAPVNCHINLRGREWTNPEGKTSVFNTLQCWKLEAGNIQTSAPASTYVAPTEEDNLPF